MSFMNAKDRLYLTADQSKLVREGDPEGATLYCAPGDQIPESAIALFGLVDGTIGGKPQRGAKQALDNPNKEKAPGDNKEKQPDGDKSGTKGAAADDLTLVKGIGAKSAAAFAKAGIASFAQIAAIDPANPPAVDGLGARVNWAGMVEAAKALVPPPAPAEQNEETATGDGGADGGADQKVD